MQNHLQTLSQPPIPLYIKTFHHLYFSSVDLESKTNPEKFDIIFYEGGAFNFPNMKANLNFVPLGVAAFVIIPDPSETSPFQQPVPLACDLVKLHDSVPPMT